MTLGQKIAWDNSVLPFELDRSGIRGRVARLGDVLDRILAGHGYPAEVEDLLAEAAVLTALIGPAIKLRWRLSLQVRGDGPVRILATDYFAPAGEGAPARMRAWASFDRDALRDAAAGAEPFGLLGEGVLAVTIDQGRHMLPYQGIVELGGGGLAEALARYFSQSEQLPTRFAVAAAREGQGREAGWRAGGLMVQQMPAASGGDDEAVRSAAERAEDWRRTNILIDTVERDELVGPEVAPTDLLVRLFHEEVPRVFPAQPITFGCTCSREKAEAVLRQMDPAERARAVTADGTITVDCQFCGARYSFAPEELGTPPAGDGPDGA